MRAANDDGGAGIRLVEEQGCAHLRQTSCVPLFALTDPSQAVAMEVEGGKPAEAEAPPAVSAVGTQPASSRHRVSGCYTC